MKGRMLATFLLSVVFLAFVCSATTALTMAEALTAFPHDLSDAMLLFTDWEGIKAKLGLDDVTSDSPLAARTELAVKSTQELAVATAYGLTDIDSHAEMWGWDLADLSWEAQLITAEMPPIYVLKLRDGFDFSRISVRLIDRGFTQTESRGVHVFTHDLDLKQSWLQTTELSILNTAYVEEGGLMILSSSPAALELCLAAQSGAIPSLDEDSFESAAVEHLGSVDSAIVLRGLGECLRFTPSPILDLMDTLARTDETDDVDVGLREGDLLVPYRAFGIGYEDVSGDRIGTIVFEYDSPEMASLDMPARLLLAEEGTSTYYDAPISEACFTVQTCELRDSAILMSVAPAANQPTRLFRMIFYVDAVFAGCSM